ncbi:hypothetical protein Tco_0756434 [Tanacetum coccineum]
MIQVKEMMQDNDLKNSKSKDKGSKSRSQSMDEQSHYKQDKTITRQSINVKRHIFNVIDGTEEFEERDLNIGGDCTLLADTKKARAVKIKARQYTMLNDVLYRKSFLEPWLRCVGPTQAEYVVKEIHEGSCSMHSGPRDSKGTTSCASLDCQEKSYLTTESSSGTTHSKTGARKSTSSKGRRGSTRVVGTPYDDKNKQRRHPILPRLWHQSCDTGGDRDAFAKMCRKSAAQPSAQETSSTATMKQATPKQRKAGTKMGRTIQSGGST